MLERQKLPLWKLTSDFQFSIFNFTHPTPKQNYS